MWDHKMQQKSWCSARQQLEQLDINIMNGINNKHIIAFTLDTLPVKTLN